MPKARVIHHGEKFGDWTVLGEAPRRGVDKSRRLFCRCKCGTEASRNLGTLVRGRSTKCRRCSSKVTGKCRAYKIPGRRFGAMTAIRKIEGNAPGENCQWEFLCDCGQICQYEGRMVINGNISPHVACRDCEKKLSTEKRRGMLPIEHVFATTSKQVSKKWEFSLTLAEYDELTTGKGCAYCGINDGRCGLDRVDSLKGYVYGNCVPCCLRCNRMKTNMHVSEFLEQIRRICKNCIKNVEEEITVPEIFQNRNAMRDKCQKL